MAVQLAPSLSFSVSALRPADGNEQASHITAICMSDAPPAKCIRKQTMVTAGFMATIPKVHTASLSYIIYIMASRREYSGGTRSLYPARRATTKEGHKPGHAGTTQHNAAPVGSWQAYAMQAAVSLRPCALGPAPVLTPGFKYGPN